MQRFAFAALALVAAGALARAGAPGAAVELGSLKSEAPAGWKKQNPSNKFRAAQFALPKAGGDKEDAELVVFHFGRGSGGSVEDNLKRWKGMFEEPQAKVEKLKVGDVPVTYLDVRGTFLSKFPPFDPNAEVTRKNDYRRLGVVFESEDGPYFITLTGPGRTVEQHKADFDRWLKAFK